MFENSSSISAVSAVGGIDVNGLSLLRVLCDTSNGAKNSLVSDANVLCTTEIKSIFELIRM